MSTRYVLIRKQHLPQARLVEADDPPLQAGQVRVQVRQFSYTANNITYAAFGDAMHYWQFFPTPAAEDRADWGCIPVWGFGVVVQSLHPGVAVGERLYGYWPMASHVVLQPARLSPAGFADAAPHRASLHAVYNQYSRCSADPYYTADGEGIQALLRPLFTTAWLIDDFLSDNAYFGTSPGGLMLLSSASSKTAYATAAHLQQRHGIEVIGLTSPRNRAFCESLGVYARVHGYDELAALDAQAPAVYVDFAGSAGLRSAVHSHFGRLAYSCAIGGTHVADLGGGRELPGPRPVLFFAPAQVKKRVAEWGGATFHERLVRAWHAFVQRVRGGGGDAAGSMPWLEVQTRSGPEAILQAHAQVLSGQFDPRLGLMLRWDVGEAA